MIYFKCLNNVVKFSIYCHYFKDEKKKVERYVQKNKIPVIALPEKTGIIVDEREAKVIGEEPVYIFDGKNLKEVFSNNKFNLT